MAGLADAEALRPLQERARLANATGQRKLTPNGVTVAVIEEQPRRAESNQSLAISKTVVVWKQLNKCQLRVMAHNPLPC